jgi:hypothetical protein
MTTGIERTGAAFIASIASGYRTVAVTNWRRAQLRSASPLVLLPVA